MRWRRRNRPIWWCCSAEGVSTDIEVLFDQVEGIRHKAAAVQAEFEEGEEDEEGLHCRFLIV